MASRGERRRIHKARTIAAAAAPREPGPATPLVAATPARSAPATRELDGLDYLLDRRRISRPQAEAGRSYGTLWRAAQSEGAVPIRISDLARAGGGSHGTGAPPPVDHEFGAWIVQARRDLAAARAAVADHEGMVAILDVVCGAGMRPRQITTVQRETEQLETALRLALDLLGRHFRARAA